MSTVRLIKGSDPVLLSDAALEHIGGAVGAAERSEVLHELSGDDYDVADIVMAASSVSMFGDRVVVARNASRFVSDDWAPFISYLADPNPTSHVIVVWDKPVASGARANPVPKKLNDAVKGAGGVVSTADAPANAKGRSIWLDGLLAASPVTLAGPATRLIVERLGEDVSRVPALLHLLESSFPAGTRLGPADIEPFLGVSGSVPPWELTDAIDRGDVPGAVDRVQRMCGGGERHPLQIMATLWSHVERMCRLDGTGIRGEDQAAAFLGIKPFPAKKALQQADRMGSAKLRRALRLLAQADVDLRGATAVPPEATIEVLVGRLAGLSRRERLPRRGG